MKGNGVHRLRRGGYYVQVRGEWFKSGNSPRHGVDVSVYPTSEQRARFGWLDRFYVAKGYSTDGWRVPSSSIDAFAYLKNYCDYAGGGPFELNNVRDARTNTPIDDPIDPSLPGHTVVVEYAGDDRGWASSLPGFQTFGPFDAMANAIIAIVPMNETTAHREVITEYPVTWKDGE